MPRSISLLTYCGSHRCESNFIPEWPWSALSSTLGSANHYILTRDNAVRTTTYLILIAVFSVLAIAFGATAAESNLKEIMQGLRDDSVAVADGLLMDDFNMVAQGADRIANHAQIPPSQVQLVAAELGPEMATFKQFDNTVHDLSLSIAAAARNNDRDQAIADYQRMLNGCFGCHAAYRERVAAVLSDVVDVE